MKSLFVLFSLILTFNHSAMALENVVLSRGYVEGTPIHIGGEEVWLFIDGQDYPYQTENVRWDVNDDRVKQVIRNCMKEASDLLASWVTNPHDPIHKALIVADKYDVSTGYFLWTNDFTNGKNWQGSNYRRASSWHWNDSLLKFESTVNYKNADGKEVCNHPVKKQAFDMINTESQKKAVAQDKEQQFLSEKPEWNASPQAAGDDKLELQ